MTKDRKPIEITDYGVNIDGTMIGFDRIVQVLFRPTNEDASQARVQYKLDKRNRNADFGSTGITGKEVTGLSGDTRDLLVAELKRMGVPVADVR